MRKHSDPGLLLNSCDGLESVLSLSGVSSGWRQKVWIEQLKRGRRVYIHYNILPLLHGGQPLYYLDLSAAIRYLH
jgi:hypothetical protein